MAQYICCVWQGIDLFEEILKKLTPQNRAKVGALTIAQEWNKTIEAKLKAVAATDFNGAQSKQIRREYGFLDERGANRHQDRLALRDVTVGHASKVLALREICAAAKELACEVVELPVGDTALPHSLEPGIGAMATPMQASALRPDPLATVADCSGDELKNTCFLCVAVGKPVAECMIEARPCTSHITYTNGHSRERHGEIVCAEFDSWATRSHKSAKQRDQMRAEAAKAKRNRLLKVRRGNKK